MTASSVHSGLLAADDPPPAIVDNAGGRSRFLLIGDHAGIAIPERLGDLGVPEAERRRHIGWDIGIAAMGRRLARLLDAPFVHQHYSRLVIDCNRDPARADATPAVSDGTAIPANAGDVRLRDARVAEIHAPYHQRIAALLDTRAAAGIATVLIALHSFTPCMAGIARPWHFGILHHLGNLRFSDALLATLRRADGLVVGDNEPYRMDGTDYTVPTHAYARDLPYAEIEVRQDLMEDAAGAVAVAERLAHLLPLALARAGL